MACARLLRLVIASFAAASASLAHACTVCDSATGHQVRHVLFHEHFLRTLFAVGSPIPVLIGAVLLLHRIMPDLDEPLPVAEISSLVTSEPAL